MMREAYTSMPQLHQFHLDRPGLPFRRKYNMKKSARLHKGILVIIFLLFSLVQTGRASAGENVWTRSGPGGGHIFALAIDPSDPDTIYVGTYSGVFKRTNATGNWIQINSGLNGGHYIRALAIDPISPNTLYVGNQYGVFKTTNGGASWQMINNGLTSLEIRKIVVNPVETAIVYAVTPTAVFISSDGGDHWTVLTFPETDLTFYTLAIDPLAADHVYVGTNHSIFKSTNNGATWSQISHPFFDPHELINYIFFDPRSPERIYATTGGDLYKSDDGGLNWITVYRDNNLFGSITDLAIDPFTPGALYAAGTSVGVYKSTDNGNHWGAINNNLADKRINSIVIDPIHAGKIMIGTPTGVYRTTDDGQNWDEFNTGLYSDATVYDVAIDPHNPSTIYAGTDEGGLYKSMDHGLSWRTMTPGQGVTLIAFDPTNSANLYAQIGGSLLKSTNSSVTWNILILQSYLKAIAISPVNPDIIYATDCAPVYLAYTSTIGKSTNGGISWEWKISSNEDGVYFTLLIDPNSPDTLYAAKKHVSIYSPSDYVIKSTDGGDHWTTVNNGLAGTPADVLFLVMDPTNSSTLYTATVSGLYKTTDGAAHWNLINTTLVNAASVKTLVIDPSNPSILYAGTDKGVYKSMDFGVTWAEFNPGGLASETVSTLAIDPQNPTILYAGTIYHGIFTIQLVPTHLTVNSASGAPGSYFTLTGTNFPPNESAIISVNGNVMGSVPTDATGHVLFLLRSHTDTATGSYIVTASTEFNAVASFFLDAAAVIHPQEGTGPVFDLPDDLVPQSWFMLPLIIK
jgi:photosystem II stability/assembly factor-like uncharacterized protein